MHVHKHNLVGKEDALMRERGDRIFGGKGLLILAMLLDLYEEQRLQTVDLGTKAQQ